MSPVSRRVFLAGSVIAATSAEGAPKELDPPAPGIRAVASENGLVAIKKSIEELQGGKDCLDAAIAGINLVEDDPKDQSVGHGGLPNEDGVVELDGAVMDGRTARGGSVASLRNIRNPTKVARLVMERSDHVLLVGEGALRFAKAHGFKEEDLLTEESREAWLRWKESLSDQDDWLSAAPAEGDQASRRKLPPRQTGTVHLSLMDARQNLAAVTSTSGLAYKIPGRVGDSPILGAGLYCDNDVGSAGSTGRGEANLLGCSSVLIVEAMRRGKSPEEACLEILERVARRNKEKRLQDAKGRPNFDLKFYAIDRQGRFGSASLYAGARFAVFDGKSAYLADCASLYQDKRD